MAEVARPVFISYARLDQLQVGRAVEFLKAGGLNVFVDSQTISYGSNWRLALIGAIESAERVMLFWTAAAAASRWVARERKLALKRGKTVVPTLLDDTPLPVPLARLHAVTTLRNLFPAPVRRPEDLATAEPPLPDDDSDDEWDIASAELTGERGYLEGMPAARTSRPVPLAPRTSSGRPIRLTMIVTSLMAVGIFGYYLTVNQYAGSVPIPPPSKPASGELEPGFPVEVEPQRPPQTSSSAPKASPPVAAFPRRDPSLYEDDDSSEPVLWVSLLFILGLLLLYARRFGKKHRARAIVGQVYAA